MHKITHFPTRKLESIMLFFNATAVQPFVENLVYINDDVVSYRLCENVILPELDGLYPGQLIHNFPHINAYLLIW